jgi:hypothetical protein
MPNADPPGEVPGTNVSGQGIQTGSGNTQNNTWMARQPLDPAALSMLNPHIAVTRLQQLSHDELVDFFARGAARELSEIIAVFLEIDESKVVGALGDISRRKATELIETVPANSDLAALPEAAEAIACRAASLKWTDAGPLKRLNGEYVKKYVTYAQSYRDGHAYWAEHFGAHITVGEIDDYITAFVPDWGPPFLDQETVSSSPFGTHGIRQAFGKGAVYVSRHGAYRVPNDCFPFGPELSRLGELGFPVSEEEPAEISKEVRIQHFENGDVCLENGEYKVYRYRPPVPTASNVGLWRRRKKMKWDYEADPLESD